MSDLFVDELNVMVALHVSGMFNSPGMQSVMQQMMSNPQMVQSLLQSPYMQSTIQSMASNPEVARQVCNSMLLIIAAADGC